MSEFSIDIDVTGIMEMLPHRYPFLLVDRAYEFEPGVSLKAYKNVTINEPFFQGHFPGMPVMPGVLQLEALAQTGGLFVMNTLNDPEAEKLFLFTGIDKVKFRRQVVPGDRLDLHVYAIKNKMNIWRMRGEAYVDGQLAVEGVMSAAVIDKE